MQVQWYCKVAGKEHGPLTAQQLVGLVKSQQLKPTDLVRRHDSKWVQAAKVKGLFPETPSSQQLTSSSSAEVTADWRQGDPSGENDALSGDDQQVVAPPVATPPPFNAASAAASASSIGRGPAGAAKPSGPSGPVAASPGPAGSTGPAASATAASGAGPAGVGQTGAAAGSNAQADDSADDQSGTSLRPGAILGNYKILETLGEGGMGVVLKAQHVRMERMVALKVLRGPSTQSPAAIKRFHQEVRAAARLSHPNIVTAYDADDVSGIHFLVMEYVNGTNLADLLSERGKFELSEVLDFVLQTAKGLDYAHGEGVVHRDIKPGNLLLDKRGVVKILDMGLASIREPDQDGGRGKSVGDVTQANQLLGTFDYMPPEQAEDPHGVDHRADIYSLGCTLYRLLTGLLMYKADSPIKKIIAHRSNPIPSIRDQRPEVPAEIDRIFRKMVAKDVRERYQSMKEVIAELENAQKMKPGIGGSLGLGGASGGLTSGLGGGMWQTGGDDLKLEPAGGRNDSSMLKLRGGDDVVHIPAAPTSDSDDDFGFNLAPVDGSEERFYWQCMGQEVGPFTLRQLRGKKLTPDDLVRSENSRKWRRASEIPGLK
ncbi:MAG TPA: protein kinase [Pirellulaceae bacterium]|nr:protein kinase [Pirellulaceae bacterium]